MKSQGRKALNGPLAHLVHVERKLAEQGEQEREKSIARTYLEQRGLYIQYEAPSPDENLPFLILKGALEKLAGFPITEEISFPLAFMDGRSYGCSCLNSTRDGNEFGADEGVHYIEHFTALGLKEDPNLTNPIQQSPLRVFVTDARWNHVAEALARKYNTTTPDTRLPGEPRVVYDWMNKIPG